MVIKNMVKKKMAIVSIYDLGNFGNRLQNVAVYKLLEKLDCDVDVIEIGLSSKKKQFIIQSIKHFIKLIVRRKKDVRYFLFLKFNKNISLSKYRISLGEKNVINPNVNKYYDYFVVGSDQVWNPEFAGQDFYFLDFVTEDKKKIAFSASVGVTEVSKEYADKMQFNLRNFNAVSVREQQANDLITSLTKRNDITTLVDPTMMITSDEWSELARKPKQYKEEKFILNYFLGEQSPERRKITADFAKKMGYKIINILDKDDPFYASGPAEFLWLEKNAKLICTDSFHSSVFAILFNTPFLVFDREDTSKNMSSRLDNLLDIFDLKDRKFTGNEIVEKYLDIDYSIAKEKLTFEKERGINFLINAIEGDRKNYEV